jgi:hypothetical protein
VDGGTTFSGEAGEAGPRHGYLRAWVRSYRERGENRGGSGIVTPTRAANGMWPVRRDIILER